MAKDDKRAERNKRNAAEKRTASSKAQVEMNRYRARRRAAEAEPGATPPFSGSTAWAVDPAAPGAATGWPLPPSVMTYPAVPGAVLAAPGGPLAQATATGSLAQGLGSTLSLGVEAVNTLLYGGVRLLQGLSGMTYGYGYSYGQAAHGCGCGGGGCGCGYSCGSSCCGQYCCCGYDCCTVLGSCGCCQPSVGNCC
jgi:hypothetical protein